MSDPQSEIHRFDEAAATWDQSPRRIQRAKELATQLRPLIRKNQLQTGLDYGAGTGLVSFYLQNDLKHITIMDASAGMVEMAQKRIAEQGLSHLQARQGDLLQEGLSGTFDLIYILMTLHHIHDTQGILHQFFHHLNPGGYLAIADLVEEDGSFHAEFPDFDGHNGFKPEELAETLGTVGFEKVQHKEFFRIVEQQGDGERAYPLFLMTARKPATDH